MSQAVSGGVTSSCKNAQKNQLYWNWFEMFFVVCWQSNLEVTFFVDNPNKGGWGKLFWCRTGQIFFSGIPWNDIIACFFWLRVWTGPVQPFTISTPPPTTTRIVFGCKMFIAQFFLLNFSPFARLILIVWTIFALVLEQMVIV